MASIRMDKWLWAARFFKTRALAARACELGRIQSNGQQVKAAREVRVGDLLRVTNEGGDFQVEVLLLSDVRGPASVAQTLYRETEARPSKRDRRKIIQFRGRA
jgi:ribosome-associated heat shock protein Hsp15